MNLVEPFICFAGVSGENEGLANNQQVPPAGQCKKTSTRWSVRENREGGVEPHFQIDRRPMVLH